MADGKISIEGTLSPALEGSDTSLTDLKKQDAAVAAIGGWSGADYMKTTGSGHNKVTATARVYSNAGSATSKPFTHKDNPSGLNVPASGNAYGGSSGSNGIELTNTAAAEHIDGASFPEGGLMSYPEGERKFAGTYKGASGTYMCSGATCTAAPVNSGGFTLVGAWTFTPAADAMVQQEDTTYLYFGWWLREDDHGPTHAGVSYRMIAPSTAPVPVTDVTTLTGTADYAGKAVGKFAINNPLGSDSDAGHFTADAMLKATFGPTSTDDNKIGLTGRIDGFRLNDGDVDPGWSLDLKRARATAAGYSLNGGSATHDSARDDSQIKGTAVEWSIGGTASPGQTGAWQAHLYDDNAKDNSTVPTVAGGSFMAGFGGTHEMVGAFGAEKQD